MLRQIFGISFSLLLLLSCSASPPAHYNPNKTHHSPEGFRNNYTHQQPNTSDFWRWQKERWFADKANHQADLIPRVPTDVNFLHANKAISMTWLGHATVLIQLNGYNVLIDPIFSDRASPISWLGPKRLVPLPVKIDQLPHIDLVLISHNHYDHLDLETIRSLTTQNGGPPLFIVPLGVDRWFSDHQLPKPLAMDWWDHENVAAPLGSIDITMTPAQHWSKRWLFGDKNKTLWGGYALAYAGKTFWYAGDTGYSQDFQDIGRHFGGFDVALIPIGAYQPRWFMQGHHVDPEEAIKIYQDVRAKYALAVHWGTFSMADEAIEQPAFDLEMARRKAQLNEGMFETWAMGETRALHSSGTWRSIGANLNETH